MDEHIIFILCQVSSLVLQCISTMTYYTYDKHFVFAQHFVSGRVCCGTSAAGTAYPSGAHEFIPGFSVDQSLILFP
jgi:Trm5-related predicted tRNA methylase